MTAFRPVVLYRKGMGDEDKAEISAAKKYSVVDHQRTCICSNDLVICRYSALPFYRELEQDIVNRGGELINTYEQHRYAADLINWYQDLRDMTPETWDDLSRVPDSAYPIVLKGETNSRKNSWDTCMFAKTRADAVRIMLELMNDTLIGQQKIYFRRYVPLVKYFDGIGGVPISHEFRIFVAYGRVVASGYYWQNYAGDFENKVPELDCPNSFLDKAIRLVSPNINFFVMDVAKTQAGEWIVVELNDGQMSGLSSIDPEILYRNLNYIVERKLNAEPDGVNRSSTVTSLG